MSTWVGDNRKKLMKKDTPAPEQSVTTLHGYMQQKQAEFEAEKQQIVAYQQEIEACQKVIPTLQARWQIRQRKTLEDRVRRLEQKIKDSEIRHKEQDYQHAVKPFLQENERERSLYLIEDRLGVPETSPVSSNPHASVAPSSLCAFIQFNPMRRNGLLMERKARNEILDDYLRSVHGMAPPIRGAEEDLCEHCQTPLQLESKQSILLCPKCGTSEPYLDATCSSMAYGDDVELGTYSYKRSNHFREWLTNFQAKESTVVPDDIIKQLSEYLFRQRIYDLERVTIEKVMDALRKFKLRPFYKHKTKIWCLLTGKAPPRLTPRQEQVCYMMFQKIQGPFEEHRPEHRKNFLSYAYCLHKFMQILGFDHLIKYFPLLKGDDKLDTQEDIWEKICAQVGWPYISSRTRKSRNRAL